MNQTIRRSCQSDGVGVRNRGFLIVIPSSSPRCRPSVAALAIYVIRMASDILIVDDEADICELVAGILQDEGHVTRTAHDSDEALSAVVARLPNLVFLDIWLRGSGLDGLQLLDSLKQQHPELPIVMISGHGNKETIVSVIKRGAYDYMEKPFTAARLTVVAERALENSSLKCAGATHSAP